MVPRVGRDQAMSVPAVKRGRDLLCGTLGTLRLKKLDARRRRVSSELLDQPEEDVARSVTMTRTFEDMLFEGRAWWRITEFDRWGYPAKVVRLEPRSVLVRENARVYASRDGVTQGQALEYVPDAELIRIDSPNDALLVAGARAIRAALALDQSASRYTTTGMPLGYFSPADGVDPGDEVDVEEILDDWEDSIARRAWPYVGAGLKANSLSWNPEQLQLASARDYAVLEISRLIGIDPEEVGVSTTSRTYANSEQRRLDLIDFTCAAYVTAMEDRLSMPDVTQPGEYVRAEYGAFLRSDTKTRMETYEVGRRVGVYDDQRIAELEDIPSAKPPRPSVPAVPAPPAAQQQKETSVESTLTPAGAVDFADTEPAVTIGFAMDPATAEFKADANSRTVSGTVIPWNVAAYSRGYKWMFAPGSLHWASESRVKLDRDHEYGSEMGRAVTLTNGAGGLAGQFKVARGAAGDDVLALAEDGVYDGLSASVTFDSEADGWTAHPDDNSIRLVHSATLRKVAITAMPAFDDARVAAVTARREDPAMTAPAAPQPPAPTPAAPAAPAQPTPQPANAPFDVAAFTSGLSEALTESFRGLIENLPQPQGRQVVPAGRVQVTREELVYTMNGQGPSFVRDAWRSRTQSDHEARERVLKFERQTADLVQRAMTDPAQFAVNTGNASAVVPPGFRPEMYVTQLVRGRPITNAMSRGTISDASPFKIPAFVSSSTATADHVEGVNPSEGSLSVGTITVSPMAISGLYKITREIADSSNPAIDAIATQAMSESYSQQSEGKVYTKINGADGVGGSITAGFVPSGAQADVVTDSAATDQGRKFLAKVRGAMAVYPFRRFAAPDWAFLSQEATTTFAGAVDTSGRPLLPWVGPQNTVGTGNTMTQGYQVDGLTFQPAWSMSGNASGDADAVMGNRNDVWVWESPLLMFRFEERSGPTFVDLALFAYHAVEVLRPVGLSGIRLTVS